LKKHDKEVIHMPKFYMKWRPELTLFPSKPEEIFKIGCSLCAMVKADLKAGKLKDWGVDPSGWSGYAVSEGLSETELSVVLQKYVTYIHFEITPVLTVDQYVESVTKAAAAAQKSAKK
jgi:hypothetical protein